MNVKSINADDEKWFKYLSQKRIEKINSLKKTNKNYNPKHVKYLLSLYFSEMAQYFREVEEDNLWFLDNFGSFKVKVFDRVVRLPDKKPFIKYN